MMATGNGGICAGRGGAPVGLGLGGGDTAGVPACGGYPIHMSHSSRRNKVVPEMDKETDEGIGRKIVGLIPTELFLSIQARR